MLVWSFLELDSRKSVEKMLSKLKFLGELVVCLSPAGKFVFMSWEVEIMASGAFRSLDRSKHNFLFILNSTSTK